MLELFEGEVKQIAEGLIANNITLNEAQDALKAAELLKKAGRGLLRPPRSWLTRSSGREQSGS